MNMDVNVDKDVTTILDHVCCAFHVSPVHVASGKLT